MPDIPPDKPAGATFLRPIVVIPARMAATRLPGKPLADILGRPMIAHVLDRAREAGIGPVAVAAGEAEIAEAARAAGAEAVMVTEDVPSGTDRVQRAMAILDPDGRYDVVVNLQGDFPTIAPETLRAVLEPLADPAVDIGTLVCPIADEEEANTASFVKCACAFEGDARVAPALYFSRQPIPWGDGPRWHHIGVYAYRRAALDRFVALPASPLEMREKLEQLRALEAGMRIAAARVDHGPFGVDTPHDLERAKRSSPGVARSRVTAPLRRRAPHIRAACLRALHCRSFDYGRSGRGRAVRSRPEASSRAAFTVVWSSHRDAPLQRRAPLIRAACLRAAACRSDGGDRSGRGRAARAQPATTTRADFVDAVHG